MASLPVLAQGVMRSTSALGSLARAKACGAVTTEGPAGFASINLWNRLRMWVLDGTPSSSASSTATGAAQEMVLESLESLGQFQERSTVAQGARLPLDHHQVMTPVIHCPSRAVMGPVDDARMLADDMAFRRDHQLVGIDPQADRSVGKRRRHAVAVTLQMDQAGR